ncbi:annexin A4-like isoform X2 [Gordionus sp. m RMFG-2023]
MKGFGTDEDTLIDIITKRTNIQRQQIAQIYKGLYNKDLYQEIKSEVSGKLEKVLLALLTPPDVYDAQCLNDAIKGLGTNESILIEILCSRTPQQIIRIKEAYKRIYGRDLERDVAGDTSGDLEKILLALCRSQRDYSNRVDGNKAQQDAQRLFKAGINKWGTDEGLFVDIFTSQNPSQLNATMQEYQRLTHQDIETSINSEMGGKFKKAFLTLIECLRYPASYFAKRLHESIQGFGTKDEDLIRIIVSRSEVDLAQIRQDFRRIYNKCLETFIKDDTSGDYEKILLALVVGN